MSLILSTILEPHVQQLRSQTPAMLFSFLQHLPQFPVFQPFLSCRENGFFPQCCLRAEVLVRNDFPGKLSPARCCNLGWSSVAEVDLDRSPAGLSCWIVPASPEPAGTCAIKQFLNLCQHVNKALFMCKALGKQLQTLDLSAVNVVLNHSRFSSEFADILHTSCFVSCREAGSGYLLEGVSGF